MTLQVGLFLLLMFILANLPFILNQRFLFAIPMKSKAWYWVMLEWLIFYFVTIVLGLALEEHLNGEVHQQDWEFWVINLVTFAIFAFPGLIFRTSLARFLQQHLSR